MATSNTARSRNNRGAERQANRRPRKEGGGGFKRFLLMLLIVLLVIAVSVGATLYYIWKQDGLPFLSNDSAETVSEQNDSTPAPAVVQPAPDATPIFTSLDPFTVTLTDGQRSRILYVAITLRVDNEESRLLLTEFMPVVRDRVLRTLSAQNPFYVQTPHGREELVDVLADVLREPFSSNPNHRAFVSNVLFTAFVVQ